MLSGSAPPLPITSANPPTMCRSSKTIGDPRTFSGKCSISPSSAATMPRENLFRKMFYLAIECRDDATLPMQDVVVFLKAAPRETDPEILAFRKELEEQS